VTTDRTPGHDEGECPTVIVRARPGDLGVLVEMNAEYCAADGHLFDRETATAGFAPLLTDDRHGAVWLVHRVEEGSPRDGSAVVDGYAVVAWSWSVEIGGAEAVLDELYVRTRGRGTGSAAIEAILEQCRAHRMKRVFLETERANERARRLYARLGFTADDSIWMSRLLP
jgi:GNAT superfamily N-acetyltransferase